MASPSAPASVPADVSDRITAAAALYAANGGAVFPTVDEVRRTAGAGAVATQQVLRDWRRRHSLPPQALPLPDSVQRDAQPLLATLWASACHAAQAGLRAEQERWSAQQAEDGRLQQELAQRCDMLDAELAALRREHGALQLAHAAQAHNLHDACAAQLARKDAESAALNARLHAEQLAAQRATVGQHSPARLCQHGNVMRSQQRAESHWHDESDLALCQWRPRRSAHGPERCYTQSRQTSPEPG